MNEVAAGEKERLSLKDSSRENPYVRCEQTDLNNEIQKALLKLPSPFRAVFILRNIDGHSYKEIAEILGIKIGTVESRLMRAKEGMRKELAHLIADGGVKNEALQIL